MKTIRFNRLVISSVLGSTLACSFVSSAEPIVATGPPAAPSIAVATIVVPVDDPAPDTSAPGAETAGVFDVAAVSWLSIKDCTFARRAEFFAGLHKLDAKVASQVDKLNAQRATMVGIDETKDWDFAIEVMKNAQLYLTSMGAESRAATAESWDAKKAKVGQAWVRTQNAYANVKFSTTS